MSVNEDKNIGDSVADRETGQGFTPGPWKAVGYSPGWWQIEGPEGEQLADVNYSDGLDEPTLYPEEANARLIAAAPTLYHAAREALRYIKIDPVLDDDGITVLGRLRIAIALVDKPANESAKRPISDRGKRRAGV